MIQRVTNGDGTAYELYHKRYFDASPTWFQWNKLTIADLLSLREDPNFRGQNVLFHLNHPIQFVRLVGLVVDVWKPDNSKWIIVRLDDGSGRSIEVKVARRVQSPEDQGQYPSNTMIDNLDFLLIESVDAILIDKESVPIGTCVKVKGTPDGFKDKRQLKLERIWVVKDTMDEVKAWSETAEWKRHVLSRPWVLSNERMRDIDLEISDQVAHQKQKDKMKRVLDAEKMAKQMKRVAKREEKRRVEEMMLDDGALKGSGVLPDRFTDS